MLDCDFIYEIVVGTIIMLSSINNAVLKDEKGRLRSEEQIMKVFETTAHDLGAIKFEV